MKKLLISLIACLLVAGMISASAGAASLPDLFIAFGYSGKPYRLQLEDNETALTIARYVGARSWNLPISGYKGFKNDDVMNYYDIPSHYTIPSKPETVTSQKAGEVYYSKPNRLLLFYHDANVKGEFTKVGQFDATDDFIEAVEKNPVLDGWGVMIINVRRK